DGFSESPAHQSLLRAWSFGQKRNRFPVGIEASERVIHGGLRVVSVDRPKLRRLVTLPWKACENYLRHEVAGLLAFYYLPAAGRLPLQVSREQNRGTFPSPN